MTRTSSGLILGLMSVGCTLDGPDTGKSSSEDGGQVDISLVLDGETAAVGSCSGTRAITTPAREGVTSEDGASTCSAAIEIYDGSCWGVFPARPTFADLEIGSASEMLDPLWMAWSSSDPEASADQTTEQWRGTMEIAEWGDERRVIDLLDGVRCAVGDDESCTSVFGTLTIEGLWEDDAAAEASSSLASWRDVSTGGLLCSSDLP